jgi:hypothetical protein
VLLGAQRSQHRRVFHHEQRATLPAAVIVARLQTPTPTPTLPSPLERASEHPLSSVASAPARLQITGSL